MLPETNLARAVLEHAIADYANAIGDIPRLQEIASGNATPRSRGQARAMLNRYRREALFFGSKQFAYWCAVAGLDKGAILGHLRAIGGGAL
jgi:hypothetical protein